MYKLISLFLPIVSPYLTPGNAGDIEGARRQQFMLQTQLAKNLFKMGQFGESNNIFYGIGKQTSKKAKTLINGNGKQSAPPLDTRNTRGVTSMLLTV